MLVAAAATVAEQLSADATRAAALDALEALAPPAPGNVALAAAPALVDVAASTEDRAEHERAVLLLARLLAA